MWDDNPPEYDRIAECNWCHYPVPVAELCRIEDTSDEVWACDRCWDGVQESYTLEAFCPPDDLDAVCAAIAAEREEMAA